MKHTSFTRLKPEDPKIDKDEALIAKKFQEYQGLFRDFDEYDQTQYKLMQYSDFMKRNFRGSIGSYKAFVCILSIAGLFVSLIFVVYEFLIYTDVTEIAYTQTVPLVNLWIIGFDFALFIGLGRSPVLKKYGLIINLIISIEYLLFTIYQGVLAVLYIAFITQFQSLIFYLVATLLQIDLTPSGKILHAITFLIDSRATRKIDMAVKFFLNGIESLFNENNTNVVFHDRNDLIARMKQYILVDNEVFTKKIEEMVNVDNFRQFLFLDQSNNKYYIDTELTKIEDVGGKKKKVFNKILANTKIEDHCNALNAIVNELKAIINSIEFEKLRKGKNKEKENELKEKELFIFDNKTIWQAILRDKATFLGILGLIVTFLIAIIPK